MGMRSASFFAAICIILVSLAAFDFYKGKTIDWVLIYLIFININFVVRGLLKIDSTNYEIKVHSKSEKLLYYLHKYLTFTKYFGLFYLLLYTGLEIKYKNVLIFFITIIIVDNIILIYYYYANKLNYNN
jgi:hypothetical protein